MVVFISTLHTACTECFAVRRVHYDKNDLLLHLSKRQRCVVAVYVKNYSRVLIFFSRVVCKEFPVLQRHHNVVTDVSLYIEQEHPCSMETKKRLILSCSTHVGAAALGGHA